MSELSEDQDLIELKKSRKIVKGLLTRANRIIDDLDNLSTEVITRRLDLLQEYWNRFQDVQNKIEVKMEEDDLDKEVDYRVDMEDRYLTLTDQLQMRIVELQQEVDIGQHDIQQNVHGASLRPLTSTISFVPFQENESFKNFIRRLDVFLHLHGKELQTEEKVYTLLHALTPQLHQNLYDLCAPDNPLEKSYTELVQMLTDFVDPQPSTWALQHKFLCRSQEQFETVKLYSVELQKLTTNCNFNCDDCGKTIANTLLRMQFIRGIRDSDIRAQLIKDVGLKSFQDVVQAASIMELAKDESHLIGQALQSQKDVNKVSNNKLLKKETNVGTDILSNSGFERLKGKCYRCGSPKHRANQCKFANETCRRCHKIGHLAHVCMGKKENTSRVKQTNTDTESLEEEHHEINKIKTVSSDKFLVDVLVEGQPVKMELDTGAAISILPYDTFKKLNIMKRIFNTNIQLRTYTGEVIKPKGVIYAQCSYKNQQFTGKLYIVDQNVDAIFGRDWMREVQLDWAEIKAVRDSKASGLDDLLNEFQDLFQPGVGKIPELRGHLQVVEGASPIFLKARPVPYALKKKVEEELQRLEEAGIITKVENSLWGTPIVPVVKPNGSVRICADFKATINKQIRDENHPIPKVEDIFTKMNGGKVFCTLDLRNAYLHLEMDDESAEMQTLSTHKGQFRVNRLMFGVKVAPGIWQRFMDRILQDVEGVQCFFDDVVIQGSSRDELFNRLERVFHLLRKQNLRLNRDKCKFFQKKILYLGHVIDESGIHKSEEKMNAIKNANSPKNVNELRSLLGLINYYNRFIKDLATLLHPLHNLLKKGERFKWTDTCEHSFQTVKEVICSDTVLCHFNPELPLILATDASPVGLGAVISHRYPDGQERPIAFASRSLSKPEQRYSQIDKEATAIYWGLKKFFDYCYGHKFTLVTDHKPLVTIFNPNKSLPSMSATRLFHYSHFLSGFDYNIEFRRTNEHGNADFLSRFPIDETKSEYMDQHNIFQINQIDNLYLNHEVVAAKTKEDNTLRPLVEALQSGKSLESFGYHDNELSMQDGCLLKGWRVIIPECLKQHVLKDLHFGHMGIVKTKALARSFCYWKGMDKDIEDMISNCRPCREKQNAPRKEENHPWEPATQPWERLHIDFMGPTNGQQFMIVVDAFSKWVEVIPTKCTTSEWVIKTLKKLFSTFGLPHLLISDNGRQFTSLVFENFMYATGITHKTTAPFHPSSNGQAERFVQTVKKTLKSMVEEPGTIDAKLHRVLMQLRQVPNSTGNCAYFLMFNRKVRTYLNLLVPHFKNIHTSNHNEPKGIMRTFKIGNRVQVRNYNGQTKWSLGQVESRDGNLHYFIKMDNGQVWRRHVDQMLRTKL